MKMKFSSGGGGINIDGIIEQAKAKGVVNAGDFVKYFNEYIIGEQTQINDYDTVPNRRLQNSISAIALSDTKVLFTHYYQVMSSTNFELYGTVCTVNRTNITAGNMTKIAQITLSNASDSLIPIMTKIYENKAFIWYGGRDKNYGVVCTVDDNTIIVGEKMLLNLNINNLNSDYSIAIKTLSSNKVFIFYGNYSKYGLVCTIDGTNIIKGTETQLISSCNYYAQLNILTENKIVIVYNNNVSSSYIKFGIVCIISETTITKGVSTQLISGTYTNKVELAVLSENKFFITYDKTSYTLYGMICEISGTTITSGTDTRLNLNSFSALENLSVVLDDDEIFIVYILPSSSVTGSFNRTLRSMFCTINNNIITIKKDIQLTSQYFSTKELKLEAVILSKNEILVAYNYQYVDSEGTKYNLDSVICKIEEDFTIKRTITNLATSTTQTLLLIGLIKSGMFIAYTISGIDHINIVNGVKYIQPLTSPTDDIYGIAKANAMEGDTVDVYRPKEVAI